MATSRMPLDIKVELAIARFKPLYQNERPRPYSELIKEYNLSKYFNGKEPTVKTVGEAISDVFVRGLVELKRTKMPVKYRRDDSLERALQSAFGLKSAIVVEPEDDASDDIHSYLGHAMASEIDARSVDIIRTQGDAIGLGSGRGTYYTVNWLQEFQPIEVDEISVLSLSGNLYPQVTNRSIEFLLDADINTAMMAQHFQGLIHTRRISWPIAHTKHMRAGYLKKTWLDEREYLKNALYHAIVGVGVLSKGHRFYDEIKGKVPSERLRPVHDYLKALVKIVDEVRAEHPDYCPVADLCNRLFFVPPPPGLKVKDIDEIKGRINQLIENTNGNLLTVTKTQLKSARNVMLIAGTTLKAPAIFWLLNRDVPTIHRLATDKDTASLLIQMKRS